MDDTHATFIWLEINTGDRDKNRIVHQLRGDINSNITVDIGCIERINSAVDLAAQADNGVRNGRTEQRIGDTD